MIILYNILQILLLPLLFIPLAAIIIFVPKYRMRSLHRLGFGLQSIAKANGQKTIWIHALSVGEVTSALPLVSGIRKEMNDVQLVFSASSKEGAKTAEKLLSQDIDYFVSFPFDILPVIHYFLRRIQPDFFILVETDFWPNFLTTLRQKNIPSMLVNGRISAKSMQSYQRFSFFFKPQFNSFQILCMQTEKDRNNLIHLGVDGEKIKTLGNLKFDNALFLPSKDKQALSFTMPQHQQLFVAGSTHKGEEEILLKSFQELKSTFPDLYLIIAPRDIRRGKEIQDIASTYQLQGNMRSKINAGGRDLFILDTIGELGGAYSHCDIAFVGGSLVAKGGHNPIEPAIFATPVLFGPHMEDFSEISEKLLRVQGAFTVFDDEELSITLHRLLKDDTSRNSAGIAAQTCIREQQGVIDRHLSFLQELL